MIDALDNLEIYCPHLGMVITFHYCRRVQAGLPCRNLLGCWEERIPAADFLGENYNRTELESAFGGLPKTRLERIFECVRINEENKPKI
jgi:hypothetical protein